MVAAIAAATIAAATLGVAGPAAATSPVVLVSSDGVNFTPALATGLFADAGLLVPGDSTTTRFWIKNPTPSPASVEVTVGHLTTPSTGFAANVMLGSWNSMSQATVSSRWSALKQCSVLVSSRTLPADGTLEVDLTITMLNATGAVAQHRTGSLNALIGMQDAAGGAISAPRCSSPVGPTRDHDGQAFTGSMAFTGTDFPTQLLLVGAVLLGAGWFLILIRRRRRKESL
jgi:LPXTG-motif cell wall-anchored protein